MRKFLCILLSAGLLMAASGCAKKSVDVNDIRLVLDWTPNTNHTGLYVALEQGYYADAGLNVEILQPPEDGALTLLGMGDAQFSVDFQESMGPAIAAENPMPVQAVAAIISHNTSGIISRAGSEIHSPRDLEGKRFAAWSTPLVQSIMRSVVEGDGGDFGNVDIVPNTVTDVISALQADIDAVWIYYAWDGIATQLAGVETNYFSFAEIDSVFDFYTPVLAVNTDFAAENPEIVKAFLAATAKGYQFAIENPEIAGDMLLLHAPELDRDLVMASQRYLAEQYQADASRWGEIDPARWTAFYDWMYSEGLLDNPLGETGFTNEYLPD